MKRKISLLLAIVMIATTVMAAMPVMTFTAVAAETPAVVARVYKTNIDGSLGDQIGDGYTTFEAAVSAIHADAYLNTDVTIKLLSNATTSARNQFKGNRKITIDGDYKIIDVPDSSAGSYTFDLQGSYTTHMYFKNVTITRMGVSPTYACAIRAQQPGVEGKFTTITLDNTKLYSFSKTSAINLLESGSGSRYELNVINNSVVVEGNPAGNPTPAIQTGNGTAKTVTINITNSAVYGETAILVNTNSVATLNLTNASLHSSVSDAIKVNGTVDAASTYSNVIYSAPATGNFGVSGATGITNTAISSFDVVSPAQFGFAMDYANALKTSPFTINLKANVTMPNHYFVDGNITVNADNGDNDYTLTVNEADCGQHTENDCLTMRSGSNLTFQNINIVLNNKKAGNGIEILGSSTLKLKNANVTINDVNHHGISARTPGDYTITIENSVVSLTAAATASSGKAIETGNPGSGDAKTVTLNITDSTIIGIPSDAVHVQDTSKATINVLGSTLISKKARALTVNNTQSTVTLGKNTVSGKDTYLLAYNPVSVASGSSLTNNAKGFLTIGNTEYRSWAEARDAANASTTDAEITLLMDAYLDAGLTFENANAKKITLNGNGKTININAHNAFVAKTDFEIKNATVNQSYNGTIFKLGATGANYAGSTVKFDNVDINVTGTGIVINACGHENSAPSDGITKPMYLELNDVHIVSTGASTAKNDSVLRFGNGLDDVRLTMKNSSIDTTAGGTQIGILTGNYYDSNGWKFSGSKGSITLIDSDIKTKNGRSILLNEKVILDADTLSTITSTMAAPIEGTPNVPADVTVNGTVYTDWKSAVEACTEETNTIVFNADVDHSIYAKTTSTYGAKFTKPTVIDGNGYTYTTGAVNALQPVTDFELKDMKINYNGTRGILHIGAEVGAAFEGANVKVENVDIVAGGANAAKYTLINAIGHANTATEAANRGKIKLDLVDVNITVNATTGKDASAAVIRWGNGNDHMDLTMINSSINTANDAGRAGLYVTAGATGSIKLVNTEIKTAENAINNLANIAVNTFDATIEGAVTGDAPAKVETAVTMKEGASVRLSSGSNGIRFTSTIPAATLEAIAAIADNTDFKFGTIITVEEAVVANGGVFKPTAEMIANGTFGGWKIRNIPGVIDNGVTVNAPAEGATYGDVEIRAALVNVKDNHITTKYAAVAYVEYTYMGETCYAYSDYDPANNRSMYEIATKALADLKTPEDEGYDATKHLYEVGGKYSPYTAAQRKTLQAYLDKAAELDLVP